MESLVLVFDGARYHGDLRYWVREPLKIVLLGCMKKLVRRDTLPIGFFYGRASLIAI
jgi:hypothetical protein